MAIHKKRDKRRPKNPKERRLSLSFGILFLRLGWPRLCLTGQRLFPLQAEPNSRLLLQALTGAMPHRPAPPTPSGKASAGQPGLLQALTGAMPHRSAPSSPSPSAKAPPDRPLRHPSGPETHQNIPDERSSRPLL